MKKISSEFQPKFQFDIRQKWLDNRIPFISCVLFGLLAYGYFLTNKITNYDDIHYIFSKGAGLDSGRWGLEILSLFIPDVSLPWLWGILTIFFFSVSICVVINLLQVRNILLQIILTGITVTFASETDIMLFMYTAPCYSIAFLFSVYAVYCLHSKNKRVIKLAEAFLFEVLAISIYQAYVLVSSGLLIILLMQRVLSAEFSLQRFIRDSITYLIFLILSIAIYTIIMLSLQNIYQVEMNHYTSSAFSYNQDSMIVRLKHAYSIFLRILFMEKYGLIRTTPTKIANGLSLLGAILVGGRVILHTEKDRKNIKIRLLAFFALAIVILPLSVNGMFLLVASGKVHSIVLFSFITEYMFEIAMLDAFMRIEGNKVPIQETVLCICALLSFCIADNIFFANKTALRQFMEYENTYSLYQSVITQIQMMPEFDSDCKLAIIGEVPVNQYKKEFGEDEQNNLFGISEFRNDYSRTDFIQHYLGFDVEFGTKEELISINEMLEFKSMPSYPYYGYINRIGNFIVVKFSDFIDR